MHVQPKLPLVRWTPPTADIVPFPCRKRIGKIRRTAELLDGTTARAATAHWRRTVGDIRRQMDRIGIDETRIDFELRDFHQAVQNELTRRSFGTMRIDGGDAA